MTSILRTRNYLRSSFASSRRQGYEVVNEIRATMGASNFEALTKTLHRLPGATGLRFGGFANYRSLHRGFLLEEIPAETEINWHLATQLQSSFDFSGLLKSIFQLEELLLTTDDPRAVISRLDAFEKKYGISLWLLELRIAAVSLFFGVEEQKKLIRHVEEREAPFLVNLLSRFWSERNEEAVIYSSYDLRASEFIENVDAPDALREYFQLLLRKQVPRTSSALSAVLRASYSTSPVDAAQFLIDALINIQMPVSAVAIDKGLIHSSMLARFLDRIGTSSVGNQIDCRQVDGLPDMPFFDRVSFWGSHSETEKGSWLPANSTLGLRILEKFKNFEMRGEGAGESQEFLLKTGANFYSLPFGKALFHIVEAMASDSTEEATRKIRLCAGVSLEEPPSFTWDIGQGNLSNTFDGTKLSRSGSQAMTAQQRLFGIKAEIIRLQSQGRWWSAAKLSAETACEIPEVVPELPLDFIAEKPSWKRKLPRQGDTSKVEFRARSAYSSGLRSPSESWGQVSL